VKTVQLYEIVENCSTNYGGEPGERDVDASVAKVSNVSDVGIFHRNFETRSFTNKELDRLAARPGDLFVVKSSGSKKKILSGKTAIVTECDASPLIASNFLLLLRPKPKLIEPRYLWRVLNSSESKAFIQTVVGAFTYPNLKWSTYSKHPIPLPPLAEQKRIAKILDAADVLRVKRRESLAQLDSLLQSMFLELFGDPIENPKGWESVRFHSIIGDSLRNGLSPSTKGIVNGCVLTLSSISSGSFNASYSKKVKFDRKPSENQMLTPDTFLICRGNGNKRLVGIGAFACDGVSNVSFPDTMIAATPNERKIYRAYLQTIWNSEVVRRQIESGARTTNGTFKVNQQLLKGSNYSA
jgi:type I restriction enzyme S subunit